jgi:hypothetical protein
MLLRVLLRPGTLRAAGGGLPAPSLPAAYLYRTAAALPADSLLSTALPASRGVLPGAALPSPGVLPAGALSAAG